MAAGNAFLALAGPIGWGIGATALIGSGIFMTARNEKIAKEATEKAIEVIEVTQKLNTVHPTINQMCSSTTQERVGIEGDLMWLIKNAPHNYSHFSRAQRERLGALINHTKALGELIQRRVEM